MRFEICNETSIFQIFTWYSWKSRSSIIYKLKILKTAKSLSRTAMTLIFCSSESWDSILFKNSKRGAKRGAREWAILFWNHFVEKHGAGKKRSYVMIFLSSSNKLRWIFRISSLKAGFQNKLFPSLAPLLAPLLNFWKVWSLSFHWNKKLRS